MSEIWKGRYNDEAVALKVLRVPQDDPHEQKTKSVSMSRDASVEGFSDTMA